MPCGVCAAAMVRSRMESSDLGPWWRGCRGLLRVRRHDRDGLRVFVASADSLGPFGRVGHRDAIKETWGRPKAGEAFAAGESRWVHAIAGGPPSMVTSRTSLIRPGPDHPGPGPQHGTGRP